MFRGTTPTIQIRSNEDLTGWSVEVDVKCPTGDPVVKTGNDVTITSANSGCLISTTLTQTETLSLEDEIAEIQIRAYKDGTAIASTIVSVRVDRILREGTIGGN